MKTQLVMNISIFVSFTCLSNSGYLPEFSSGNNYCLKRVHKENNKNEKVLSILTEARL